MTIIFGNVNKDGSIRNGSGDFEVTYVGTGQYLIDFADGSFQNPPAIVLTQNYRSWTDFSYDGGDSRDNAVLIASDHSHAKVLTGNGQGGHEDRNFTFVAVGD